MREAARRLSLPVSGLKNWVNASREGKLAEVGQDQKPVTELALDSRGCARHWRK